MFPSRHISLARYDCLPPLLDLCLRSLVRLPPLRLVIHPVLYNISRKGETVPIDLSGRTSYLQVRLAYYPYPQVIPRYCNINGFGLPSDLHRNSPCSWLDHLVSGLMCGTNALLVLAFALHTSIKGLMLHHTTTRRFILQ